MKLTKRCERNFDALSRVRGTDYFKSNRVRLEELRTPWARLSVQGTTQYDIVIDWQKQSDNEISTTCSCPRFLAGALCKHIWASLCLLETLPPARDLNQGGEIRIEQTDELSDDEFDLEEFKQDESEPEEFEQAKLEPDEVSPRSGGPPYVSRLREVNLTPIPPRPVFHGRTLSLSRDGIEEFHPMTIWDQALDAETFFQLQRALAQNLVIAVTVTRPTHEKIHPSSFDFELAIRNEGSEVVENLTAQLDRDTLRITCGCEIASLGICTHIVNGMVFLQFALTQAPIVYGYSDWRLKNRVGLLRRRINEATSLVDVLLDLRVQDIILDLERRRSIHNEIRENHFSVRGKIQNVPNFFVTPARFDSEDDLDLSDYPIAQVLTKIRLSFSDGSEFSLYELLYHPFIDVVPKQIRGCIAACFFVTETSVAATDDLAGFADLFGLSEDRINHGSLLSLSALFQSLQNFKNESTEIIGLRLRAEKVVGLSSISFRAPPIPVIEIDAKDSKLIIKIPPSDKSVRVFVRPRFAYDLNLRTLEWDPGSDNTKDLRYRLIILASSELHGASGPCLIDQPENLVRALKFLQAQSHKGIFQLKWLTQVIHIPEIDCRVELRVESTGAFSPLLLVTFPDSQHVRLSYFSEGLRRVTRGLHGGLAEFFQSPATDLALNAQGDRRKNDLKVLKHRGAFLFIYVQTVLRLDNEAAQNEKMSAYIDRVHQEVLDLVFEDLKVDPAICSKKIKILLKQTIEIMQSEILAETVTLAHEDRLFCVEDYGKILNRALLSLVRIALTKKSPANIFRARGSIFEANQLAPFLENQLAVHQASVVPRNASMAFDRFESSDWFDALPELQTSGLLLFVNNQPIYEMDSGDLRSEFSVDGKAKTISAGRVDWFALHPKIFFRGKEIAWRKIRHERTVTILEHEGRNYLVPRDQLPTLVHLHDFWEQLIDSQPGRSRLSMHAPAERIQLKRHQILELLVLRLRGVEVRGGPGWDQIWSAFENLGRARDALAIRSQLSKTLKPYQHEGIQWLVDLEKLKMGAVLADDMGLGKTLQTLGFLEHISATHLNNLGRYLVIVPTSLAYNWISESEKYTPGIRTRFLHPTKFDGHLDPGLYVTTYGLMAEHAVYFQSHSWNVVIFDEAQNLKSFTTTRYKAAAEIPGDFKIALTGTPLENHLGELFAIIDLVLPGALGDYVTFKKHFLTGTLVAAEEVQKLRMVIKPILLRRTKDKILRELPPKIESIHLIPFETQQRKIYRDIAVSWNERILSVSRQKPDENLQLQMLTALMRLRQACSDPAAIPGVTYKKIPPKIEHLIEQIREVIQEGHSVLVFTQFLHTLARVQGLLEEAEIKTFILTGAVSVDKRKRALADFDACATGSVLLMTLKTGGVGLNLTKASYVFHIEPWWNPAVENQATDRAHRLGQTQSVQVYRYIMKDSLEEKIQELKAIKKSRFDMVFSEDIESLRAVEAQSSHLSREDFEYLLK